MAMDKLTVKDSVVRHFAEEIISGKLKPGDKLPGEREIAESMEISRSVVHLAMEQMAAMKLIKMQPRIGNFVCDFRREGNFSTMMFIAEYGDAAMDMEMSYALVELRNTIEGAAMRQLAKIGKPEDFQHLRELNEEFKKKSDETDEFSELAVYSSRFHRELIYLGDNSFYAMVINSFSSIRSPWIKCLRHWTPQGIYQQNLKIISLLEKGRGDEAAEYIADIFKQYKAEN